MNPARNKRAPEVRALTAAEARERIEACELYFAKAQAEKSQPRMTLWQRAARAYRLIEIAAKAREQGMFA